MFYELELRDLLGQTPWKRGEQESNHVGTFQATIDQLAQITLLTDKDAYLAGPSDGANLRVIALDDPFDPSYLAGVALGTVRRTLPDG